MTASCSFDPPSLSGGDRPDGAVDPMTDAGGPRPDADPDAPDARVTAPDAGMGDAMEPDARLPCQSWPRPRHFDPCDIPQPIGELVLDQSGDYTYDTNTGTLSAPGGATIDHAQRILSGDPEVRLVSVDRFVVGANARLRATGDRPLLVASWSEIVVDGFIDVSSSLTDPGAGANTGSCSAAGEGGQGNNGGGGGGGGGLNGDGGAGGQGAGGGAAGTRGDKVAVPTTVRGGCAGARGGQGDEIDEGDGTGGGGAGGGALQLTARTLITINGRLHAGGAGGGGATSDPRRCGGGGGGSGGLISLEAPMISIEPGAIIAANGGGGGEGSENGGGNPGTSGQLGVVAALGGSLGDALGGDGGLGGALAILDAGNGMPGIQSGPQRAGGGGGGGGAGYIIFQGAFTVKPGAVVSPAQSTR
jgi:hypothetical protein